MDNQAVTTTSPITSPGPAITPIIPPSAPKKSITSVLLIILSLAFLILIIIGVIIYQDIQLQRQKILLQTQSISNVAVPSETQTAGDTATWKTYTLEKLGFSFKYPDSYFKYLKDFPDIGVYLAPSQGNMAGPAGLEPDDVWIDVSIQSGANVKSLDQFIALQGQGPMYVNIQGKNPVLIDGVQGYKIIRRFIDGNIPVANYEGIVLKDEILYHIILSAHTEEVLVKNEQLFDQILSTFQFTN